MSWNIRFPIWMVLSLTFGGVTTLAVAISALVIYILAVVNTTAIARDIADRQIDAIEQALKDALNPALDQVEFMSGYVMRRQVDATDDQRLTDLLMGSLAASPQVEAVSFIRADLHAISVARQVGGRLYVSNASSGLYDTSVRNALRAGTMAKQAMWGTPVYVPALKKPLLSALAPVRVDGHLLGVFVAVVSLPEISDKLDRQFGERHATPFILIEPGKVLAHRLMQQNLMSLTVDQPLLDFSEIGDPVLAQLKLGKADLAASLPEPDSKFLLQEVESGGYRHLLIFTAVPDLIELPLIVGFHIPVSDVESVFEALNAAAYAALIVILIAIALALVLGRLIGRPVRALADATQRLAILDFPGAPTLARSRFTEIDIAADAYNRMRSGLGWFSTYVPHSLVPLLMRPDSEETLASREVDVTILFTDIVGFSGIAQRLSARRLAAFLNRHFSLLGRHIEVEGGSIDKYIGDSIMAFWGAPEAQEDHAARAARAALAIADQLAADNARRDRKGLKPVRVRIGIHSGRAVAGNIGAVGRINYTLVGDAVNIAQRLEQFGKRVDDGKRAAVISLSADTADQLPGDLPLTLLGDEVLPGRAAPTKIYRLGNGG